MSLFEKVVLYVAVANSCLLLAEAARPDDDPLLLVLAAYIDQIIINLFYLRL